MEVFMSEPKDIVPPKTGVSVQFGKQLSSILSLIKCFSIITFVGLGTALIFLLIEMFLPWLSAWIVVPIVLTSLITLNKQRCTTSTPEKWACQFGFWGMMIIITFLAVGWNWGCGSSN